jgi:23S rRNA (adenine1618-N6)-methyltransferase
MSGSLTPKAGLHPRNRFRDPYDFETLAACSPRLAPCIVQNAHGNASIRYSDPEAVIALNQALLKHAYGLEWDLPNGFLCPPIPGRSDYLHHLADLLSGGKEQAIPRGPAVKVLDIGTGANCIYPLIGASEYGWRFAGSEIDPDALCWARQLVRANPSLTELIECRLQPSPFESFAQVTEAHEHFDLSLCNPPFHASAAAAAEGTLRKLRNLGKGQKPLSAVLNFGGKAAELWCEGGELGFLQRMIIQSAAVPQRCRWFTSLVSKSENLPPLHQALHRVSAAEVRTIAMAQGQKKSRILAWTFSKP